MNIGILKEIKDKEFRVSMTPAGVEMLVHHGHQVMVEKDAGAGSGFTDEDYANSGATVIADAAAIWTKSEMVMKVKEPLESEYKYLRPGLLLFTYLHLAAVEPLTKEMMAKGVTGVAYETVELPNHALPLLIPMSEVAGRMSVQIAAFYLQRANGGRGKLLGGVPGVRPADVVIIGGGIVGTNAAKIALGMGAHVTVIDVNTERLRYLDDVLHGSLTTVSSTRRAIADSVAYADVVIGAVLIKGARAPHLVTREMVSAMKPGSVIVDVDVDQGGCVETSHPTSHTHPTYFVDGVLHYAVANMPGAVPRTSTYALANATLPYALQLADKGFVKAVKDNPALAKGVNTYKGEVTYPAVAEIFNLDYRPIESLLD